MKSNTKTKVPTLARQSQKTLIITAALAYLVQSVMMGQFFYTVFTGQFPSISTFVLYPITAIALPVVSFLLVYLISSTSYTKLWRTSQAAIVAFLAVITEGFLSAANQAIFSSQLGYANVSATESGSSLLQWLPLVVTLAAVVGAGVWLRRQKATPTGDASTLFQKGFVILLPLVTFGQMAVMYFGYRDGSAPGQAADSGMMMGVLSSLVIPAIVWVILFLLTARKKTTLQRLFTSLVYIVIGVLFVMTCVSVAYLIIPLGISPLGGEQDATMNIVPPLFALTLFAGLVAWHKSKRLL